MRAIQLYLLCSSLTLAAQSYNNRGGIMDSVPVNNLARYARNPMVKNYLAKLAEREKPKNVARWYYVDTNLLPKEIADKYEANSYDAGTEEFVEACYEKSDWFFTQVYHSVARTVLGFFMSMTSVNGLLNRGAMFVFSEAQFQRFLDIPVDWKADSLLDIGAGDGKVTEKILHHFRQKFATEQSPTMQWRLQEKGFKILDIDEWSHKKDYSVVTALNLLDRIDTPMKFLRDLHSAVRLGEGLIVLAIVLPYSPCHEKGSTFGEPQERLPINGETIEEQIVSLHDDVFTPNGFEVVKFTRLPYLCEGDLHNDFFLLTDIVFLLKTTSGVGKVVDMSESSSSVNVTV